MVDRERKREGKRERERERERMKRVYKLPASYQMEYVRMLIIL